MSYAKFDDRCPEHPKIVALTDREFRAWFEMVCYCARNLTDGLIVQAVARRQWGRLLPALRAKGVLEDGSQGVRVHDYLQWNDSKETVEKRRERARLGGYSKSAASTAPSSTPSTAQTPAQALHSSRTTTEVQDPNLPADAAKTNGEWPKTRDSDYRYLLLRLAEGDPGWRKLTGQQLGLLQKLYGRPVLKTALGFLREAPPSQVGVPFALIKATCETVGGGAS